jgi:hypothetical protein
MTPDEKVEFVASEWKKRCAELEAEIATLERDLAARDAVIAEVRGEVEEYEDHHCVEVGFVRAILDRTPQPDPDSGGGDDVIDFSDKRRERIIDDLIAARVELAEETGTTLAEWGEWRGRVKNVLARYYPEILELDELGPAPDSDGGEDA